MYKIIQSLLAIGNPKVVIKWDKLISDAHTRFDIMKDRFLLSDINLSPPVYLFKSLIANVDIDYLLKLDTDLERYTKYLVFELDNLRTFFDPAYIRRPLYDCFIKSQSRDLPEFILNVNYKYPMLDMPLDEDWETWKDIKPASILYYDSMEIPNLLQYQLKFKTKPSYCTSSVNITLLILKFIHYLKEYHPELKDKEYYEHINDYLKECVFINFFDDALTIWCTNIVINILNNKNVLNKNYYIVSSLDDAALTLEDNLDKVRNNNITIRDFCHTKYLNDKSIVETLDNYLNKLRLPDLRQYEYMQLLRDLPLMYVITMLCKINNNFPSDQIKLKLIRQFRLLKNKKIIDTIPNTIVKDIMQDRFDEMINIVDYKN